MKVITITGDNYLGTYSSERSASRGIVVKDNKVLLSCETKNNVYMFPGGGREIGETPEENVIREVKEETGFIVKPIKQVLQIEEYYRDLKFVTYYFLVEIIDKGESQLTPVEEEFGLEAKWVDIEEALQIFSIYEHEEAPYEELKGLYFRELSALKEILSR